MSVYTVRVTEECREVREVTVQSEYPMEAVFEGLEQLQVESLEEVKGIEVRQTELCSAE